ncbi:tRNA pseudouridine(55) synthase TruB [Gammaproteobacteria bacterium]|nr:tRNA pseudouridine(55) synthase TruB [Gammaproteobacteria bacterium]
MTNGFILIDKESGVTSSRVVQAVKKKFQFKKVGHLGTLDPMATGLLILAINRGTKFSSLLLESHKTYAAEVTLGIQTDTDDAEGEHILSKVITCSDEEVRRKLLSFLGSSMQQPPIYSALKVQGKPMYKYAREGIKVEKAARAIEIKTIENISINLPKISFEVSCSKGTYIRSIARDLGEILDCGGHLSALKRLTQQNFSLKDAKTIDEINEQDIIPLEQAFNHLDSVHISEEQLNKFMNGSAIDLSLSENSLLRVYNSENVFIALGRSSSEGFKHEYLV